MRWIAYSTLAAFALDQASKAAILYLLNLPQIRDFAVWPPFLQFHMAWNTGVNFGLFAGNADAARWILIALSLAICAGISIWAFKSHLPKIGMICVGLLVGGALGNALDRVIYGAVVDFLNMSCCGINNPYAFNVADIFIFVGAIGLAIFPTDKKDG